MIHSGPRLDRKSVTTPRYAERLVRWARYAPEGRRSCAPPVRAAKYGFVPFREFWRQQNEDVLVIPLIEEREAVERLPQILRVRGLDVIFFGPFDYSMTLGLDGECDLPEIWKQLAHTVRLSHEAGLPVANLCWDLASCKRSIEAGCQMILYDVDMVIFRKALTTYQESIDKELRAVKPGSVPARAL